MNAGPQSPRIFILRVYETEFLGPIFSYTCFCGASIRQLNQKSNEKKNEMSESSVNPSKHFGPKDYFKRWIHSYPTQKIHDAIF